MIGVLSLVLAASASADAVQTSQPMPTLQTAIEMLRNFDDTGAQQAFERILATHPSPGTEARCHLYLGLIALNALKSDLAEAEFLAAVRTDITLEPTREFPPKARILLDQARQRLAEESQAVPLAAVPPAPAPVPVSVSVAPPSPSHVPAYVLGGVAVGAAAVGTVFGILANQALTNAKAASLGATAKSDLSASGSHALVADCAFAVAGGAAIAAILLFATEGSARADPPAHAGLSLGTLNLMPLRDGAAASLGGRF